MSSLSSSEMSGKTSGMSCHQGHQGIGTSRMSSGMLGTSLAMSGRTLGRTGKTCLPWHFGEDISSLSSLR